MSHIPSTAMPHAQARGDVIDDQPSEPEQRQPQPEATTATSNQPMTPTGSSEPAGSTGNRGTHAFGDTADGSYKRSTALIAAMVLGGLAALGGVVAAALPLMRDKPKRKGKRRKV